MLSYTAENALTLIYIYEQLEIELLISYFYVDYCYFL